MLLCLFLLLLCAAALISGEESKQPGSVVFWTNDAATPGATTNTKTMDASTVSEYLSSRLPTSEAVVVLSSNDGRASLQHSSVRAAMQQAMQTVAMPFVYTTSANTALEETKKALLATKGLEGAQKLSLGDFLKKMTQVDAASGAVAALNNGKTEVYEVVLSGHESEREAMAEVQAVLGKARKQGQVLFVALREATAQAPKAEAHYSRVLAASSNLLDGIYYKPEGAEYAIYYADTYLYLTPDIFTGLLSGIFFLSAVFVGFSCMNQIQGPTSFTQKEQMPAIGKEA